MTSENDRQQELIDITLINVSTYKGWETHIKSTVNSKQPDSFSLNF
jgi:hypothetical protein